MYDLAGRSATTRSIAIALPRQPVRDRVSANGTRPRTPTANSSTTYAWNCSRTATTPAKGQPPAGPLGAVAFKGGYDSAGYNAVMNPIDFDDAAMRTPDAEECWLAQEDFWVKRELLYVVRDAVLMAARLDPVAEATDQGRCAGQGREGRQRRQSSGSPGLPQRQLGSDAAVRQGRQGQLRISPDSRIKNIHVSHREQMLGNPAVPIDGAFFRIRQGERRPRFLFPGRESALGQGTSFRRR